MTDQQTSTGLTPPKKGAKRSSYGLRAEKKRQSKGVGVEKRFFSRPVTLKWLRGKKAGDARRALAKAIEQLSGKAAPPGAAAALDAAEKGLQITSDDMEFATSRTGGKAKGQAIARLRKRVAADAPAAVKQRADRGARKRRSKLETTLAERARVK